MSTKFTDGYGRNEFRPEIHVSQQETDKKIVHENGVCEIETHEYTKYQFNKKVDRRIEVYFTSIMTFLLNM